jgi:hypothetical protein
LVVVRAALIQAAVVREGGKGGGCDEDEGGINLRVNSVRVEMVKWS